MSTTFMTQTMAEASPRFKVRVAGLLYLANVLAFVPAAWIHTRLALDSQGGANTLTKVALAPHGFGFDLIAVASSIAVTALSFYLFKPVSRNLSLVAAFIGLAGSALASAGCLLHLACAAVLKVTDYLPLFTREQLRAAAWLFRLHSQAAGMGIVFFALYCLLIGCLIFRSGVLPRPLGVLMTVTGLGWLTFLSTALARSLSHF